MAKHNAQSVQSPDSPNGQPHSRFDRIPADLKIRPHWVGYKNEIRDGKITKVPYQVKTGRRHLKAQTDNPATWGGFQEAWTALLDPKSGFDGIGYVFSKDDPYVGIDFDNCLKDDQLLDWAKPYLAEFAGTYGEISQSRGGIHVICSGQLSGTGTRRNGFGPDGSGAIEMYDQCRFFVMTGEIWRETETQIEEFPLEIAELYAKLKEPKSKKKASPPTAAPAAPASSPAPSIFHSDDEVIERIEQDVKARALWQGDMTGYPSQSEADFAFLNHLVYFCGSGQHDQVKRLFLLSGLGARTKAADRLDYLDRSTSKVYDTRTVFYRWTVARPKKSTTPPPPGSGGSPPGGGQPGQPDVNEAADDPHRLGRIFLKSRCEHQGKRTLVYHQGEFHQWEQSAYRPAPEHEISRSLNVVSKAEFDRLNKIAIKKWELAGGKDDKGKEVDPPVARKVSTKLIGDINQAIGGMTLLSGRVEPPHWLIDNPPFPAADVLPMLDALVHLPTFVQGKPKAACQPTPEFFCPYTLDYRFDPNAPIPQAWIDFLVSVWPKDPECIDTLQEWMGYLLTLDTRQQKIAMLIGPPRSGRGTISRVISGLVGPANVANPTFAGLASHFGAACLIGKPVAVIGDARQSHRSDWAIALERLLMISGEDAMTIDRKNRPDWTGRLPTRLILISNELPKFSDSSGALAARLLLFRFTESFVGKEDRTLDAKLQAELPGILLWAIEGWKRLRNRGHFLQPKTGQDLIDQFQDLSSPVGAFVRERVEIGAGFSVKVEELFDAWKDWCVSRNREPGEQSIFGRNLRTVVPNLKTTQPRQGETRIRCFEGLRIKQGTTF